MNSVPSYAQGAFFLLIAAIACITSGHGSIFPSSMGLPSPTAAPKSCPLYSTKARFDLQKVIIYLSILFMCCSNIIHYNQVDCKVLWEIVTYLRNNHC